MKKRSIGVRLVNVLLFGLIALFSVLILRLALTYWTSHTDSLFVLTKEEPVAESTLFYVALVLHAFTLPVLFIIQGLLIQSTLRRKLRMVHEILGKVFLIGAIVLAFPSSLILAFFSDFPICFYTLSVGLLLCSIMTYRYRRSTGSNHFRWAIRTLILMFSAVILRVSIIVVAISTSKPVSIETYGLVAWCSWLVPLFLFEGIVYAMGRRKSKPLSS